MINKMDAAVYFLSLDKDRKIFAKEEEGSIRLDKYLHMAQNIHLAKYGEPLMDSVFYANDNGAADPDIQKEYPALLNAGNRPASIGIEEKRFLSKIYYTFRNAPLDELIALSCEDPEWMDKHGKVQNRMDSMARRGEYAEQYADIVKALDRISPKGFADILKESPSLSEKHACQEYRESAAIPDEPVETAYARYRSFFDEDTREL